MQSSADGQDDRRSMPAAALFAVALHALAIAGLTLWRPVPPVTPPGQQEITIDLAPAMEQAEAVSPAEVSRPVASAAEEVVEPAPEPQPVETVQEPAETAIAAPAPEPQPVETVQEPTETAVAAPAEANEATADAQVATTTSLQNEEATEAPATTAMVLPPETSVIESAAPEAPALTARPEPAQKTAAVADPAPPAPPILRTRKPAPKPERPEQKPAAKPAPNPPVARQAKPAPSRTVSAPSRSVAARQAPAAADSRAGAASASREEIRGSAAAADPNAMSRYAAQLAAALRARLRYPEAARAQGIGGVATLRFTLHRSGRVVAASLVRSAGHAALDQAALATASPGSSLPPAPEDIPQQQLTISVPLRFSLN